VARIGGRSFRSDNRSWPSEGLLSPEASGAEAHNLGIGSMSELKLRPPDFNCLLFLAATPAGKMPALLTSDSRHQGQGNVWAGKLKASLAAMAETSDPSQAPTLLRVPQSGV